MRSLDGELRTALMSISVSGAAKIEDTVFIKHRRCYDILAPVKVLRWPSIGLMLHIPLQ